MRTKFLILLAGVCLVLANCNTKTNTNSDTPGITNDTSVVDTMTDLTYLLLSPNEILSEIFTRKITLNPDIVNPKENASKYINTKQSALNLGVYIADFAYLNLNKNRTNSIEYFKVIKELSQRNNIYSGVDANFFNRIQNNLANNDSLISISQEMYYSMSDDLENANRQNIYSLIASGALIESMYLSVMNVTKFSDFQDVAQRIFEQIQLFDSFYEYISRYKKNPEVESIILKLDELRKILNESKRTSQKITVKKDKTGHLSVKGGERVTVSEETFILFKENVIKTREYIVSTK